MKAIPLSQMMPMVERPRGEFEIVLIRDEKVIKRVCQKNLVTRALNFLSTILTADFWTDNCAVFVSNDSRPMHERKSMVRNTYSYNNAVGSSVFATSVSVNEVSRTWTVVGTIAPPAEDVRDVRMVGLATDIVGRCTTAGGLSNTIGSAVGSVYAATVLSTPIIQDTLTQVQVSYRLNFKQGRLV